MDKPEIIIAIALIVLIATPIVAVLIRSRQKKTQYDKFRKQLDKYDLVVIFGISHRIYEVDRKNNLVTAMNVYNSTMKTYKLSDCYPIN